MESQFTKKLIRSKSGLKIVTVDENLESPFFLSEPQWTPDREIKNCSDCNTKFDFLRRKHHCRRCGRIYCGSCCDKRIGLPRMCFVDPVRVCEKCAIISNKEKQFFDQQLKILINGATFFMSATLDDNFEMITCRLSSDHRHLILEGAASNKWDPVELIHIKSVDLSKNDISGTSSIEITYAKDELNDRRLKFICGPEPYRRTSCAWMFAIHQAFEMLYAREKDDT